MPPGRLPESNLRRGPERQGSGRLHLHRKLHPRKGLRRQGLHVLRPHELLPEPPPVRQEPRRRPAARAPLAHPLQRLRPVCVHRREPAAPDRPLWSDRQLAVQ
uniref:(northern house mosquito) hypothetical protein n=1 Tax=Culex pipiens TaxID=7175 RepID=A0A8D8FV35_CULPI